MSRAQTFKQPERGNALELGNANWGGEGWLAGCVKFRFNPSMKPPSFLFPFHDLALAGLRSMVLLAFTALKVFAAGEAGFYKLGPDSLPQEGVPKGKLAGPAVLPSEVFPGTQHTYWVYVPAQYDSNEPAALMIFNDGQAMIATNGDVRVPNVMDNLIWRREIPLMLAVFINPGRR